MIGVAVDINRLLVVIFQMTGDMVLCTDSRQTVYRLSSSGSKNSRSLLI